VDIATLLLLGAAGGAVRGIMHAYDCMTEWLDGRQQHRLASGSQTEGPPSFRAFYDFEGESIAAVVHAVLGALVAGLLGKSGQISGGFTVFAAGASAPLLLVQLKNSRLADAILGEGAAPASPEAAPPGSSAGSNSSPGPGVNSTPERLPPQRPAPSTPGAPAARHAPLQGSTSQQDGTEGSPADQDGAG
jgi:hypothetical protein